MKTWLPLLLILFLGASLRIFHLADDPIELTADEIHPYLSVRSIVMTGHDRDGLLYPFLDCVATRNPPIYGIAQYVSSLIFGKNPFALRFPAAVFGLAAIVLLYAIAFELTKRRSIALLAALFQAIAPIFIHYARVGWEPASELPFLLGGWYALLRGLRDGSPRFGWLAVAALTLGAAVYTYSAAWFYAALLGGTLLLLHASRFRAPQESGKLLAALTLWATLALPGLEVLFTDPHTSWRTFWVWRFKDGVSYESIHGFLSAYAQHFGWPYLVVGDEPNQRFQRELGGFGALYWWMPPLVIAGLLNMERYLGKPWRVRWVWIWLLSYPLGGSLTFVSVPDAGRTLAGAPAFSLIAALGGVALLDISKLFASQRLARGYALLVGVLCTTAVVTSVNTFASFYFRTYPSFTAPAWESGKYAAFEAIRNNAPGYQRVCFSGGFSYISSYISYFIDDVPLRKIENIYDPLCSQPGTLLLTAGGAAAAYPGFTLIEEAKSIDGSTYAVLEGKR